MTDIVLRDGLGHILVGDVLARLGDIPEESIDCVAVSPPYWGLRDYDVEGQIGLEPTLGEHLDVMVGVFAEVHRVLKSTGTVWLNYGDCYATAPNGRSAADTKAASTDDRTFRDKPFSTSGPIRPERDNLGNQGGDGRTPTTKHGPIYDSGYATARGKFRNDPKKGVRQVDHGGRVVAGGTLKPKDLCMIPNRLAIALQEWGWWVRSEIIWGKTNPMPDSSGAYRPSTAHEKIFLLTKSDDGDVWRARDTGEISFNPNLSETCALVTKPDMTANRWVRIGSYYDATTVRQGMQPSSAASGFKMPDNWDTGPGAHGSRHRDGREKGKTLAKGDAISARPPGTRPHKGLENAREDWRNRTYGRSPRHEGHIGHEHLASVPRGGGRFLRNYEPAEAVVWPMATRAFTDAHFATFPPELVERCLLAGCPQGGTVLDPFGGAGTTALVALRMGRRPTLIELNPDYAELARKRIERDWMGLEEAKRSRAAENAHVDLGPLFSTAPEESA